MVGLESVMVDSTGYFLPQKMIKRYRSIVLVKYFPSMMVLGLMILSLKSLKNGANKFYQGIVVTSLLI
jgi:hypothetical protein